MNGGHKMDSVRTSAMQSSYIYQMQMKSSGSADDSPKIPHTEAQAYESDSESFMKPVDTYTPAQRAENANAAEQESDVAGTGEAGSAYSLPDSSDVKIPYQLNPDDCYQSRNLKGDYSSMLNSMTNQLDQAEQLNQDIQNIQNFVNGEGEAPQGNTVITQNGEITTVRVQDVTDGLGLDGQPAQGNMQNHWTEYSYNADGSYMSKTEHIAPTGGNTTDVQKTLQGSTFDTYVNGEHSTSFTAEDSGHMTLTFPKNDSSISLDGNQMVYTTTNGTNTYSMNENGDLRVSMSDGRTSTAAHDGSYQQGLMDKDGQALIFNTVPAGTGPDAEHSMAYYDSLAQQMGSSVDGEGKVTELTSDQQYLLGQSLTAFSPDVLENLNDAGVQYMIFDENDAPPGNLPNGADQWPASAGAFYTRDNNIVSIKGSDLENGGSALANYIIHHETGHAIDDVLVNDTFNIFPIQSSPFNIFNPQGSSFNMFTDSAEGQQDVGTLYNSYLDGTKDGTQQTWSDYAKTNVQEYFAEGVALYVGNSSQRDQLRQQDPELFSYLEQLFTSQFSNQDLAFEDARQRKPYNPAFTPPAMKKAA